ncbi:MAG TPA: TonB-dependent receptor [Caulobacteraceae bacterium]|jgi:iron complex outermembrane receptor protein
MKNKALLLCATMLSLAWCGAAYAQQSTATVAVAPDGGGEGGGQSSTASKSDTTVQEVVVTAERRTTPLQKTAIAATVLSGNDLTKNGVFTVDQLQFVSPSLTVDNFGQGNDIDIRGIGKGEHNTQTGTGVVTYRDGAVTFPGYFAEEPYYDVADVEVLRGPQGTFAGQNATGGAIIVNTVNPVINGGYTGYLLGHYGNYNDFGLQGAVNIPVSDTFAARVSFNTEYRDTFYKIGGPWTGDPNLKWESLRLSLLWTPTPQLTVSWKTDASYLDNGGYFGDSLLNKGTSHLFDGFSNDFPTYAVDDFVRSTLKIDYVMDSGITLRSVTSGQTGRTAWTGDIDGTAFSEVSIAEAVDETLLSQEFNLISPNTGPVRWVLGAYYQSNVYNFPIGQFDIGFPPGGLDEALEGTNRTHTEAAFGQVSFELPHGLELQVGARYSGWYTKNLGAWTVPEFVAFGYTFPINQTYSGQNLTGKVTLNWNIDDHNFAYAFVATGAKPGGLGTPLIFSGLFGAAALTPPFKQEYVTDYEVGWKSTMMDGHLRTQLGAYYNEFRNFQVILPIPDQPTQTEELNVPGSTKLYGVEASAQGVFGPWATDIGVALAHSSLPDFYTQDPRLPILEAVCNPTTGPGVGSCINLKGHPQTYAPNFTFNAGVQYDYHLAGDDTLTPRVSYSHISKQYATLFDNPAAGDYLTPRDIVNASIAWKHGDILTTLYCYNLTDDHYVSAAASPIRLAGAPRQFGISIMKTF